MAHPIMFDEDDPLLARVREVALAFPEAAEKVSHGRPVFYTKKIFASYGAAVKVDGIWRQHPQSVLVLPDDDERHALAQDDRCFVPGYLGAYGWIGLDVDTGTDWEEVRELMEMSYRRTAPPRLVRTLDANTNEV